MSKLVLINQWSSHLTKDIINAFADSYDDIALISGNISQSGNPLNERVRLHQIIKYNKKRIISRIFTWVVATIQIIFLVNTKYRKYHLLLTSNPPFLTFLPLFCGNPYSIQILDIYPDALVAGGFIKQNSWLNKMWTKQNKNYFGKAKNVFTITGGMSNTISQYASPEKIKVIMQWPSSSVVELIERDQNEFIRKHNLQDYFIVMYSGNIGLGHHVDILIEVANYLKEHNDILFTIIGEGWNKPVIEKMIENKNLKNCLVLPFQPNDMFKHSSQAPDIGVVSVSKELAPLCVPIKTYNMMNNNVPLLCITEGESELERLVSKYNVGRTFSPEQIKEMAEYIISLKSDKSQILTYKVNLKICSKNFTPANATQYVKELQF